jgi:lysophospholipase L1-like esterase
MGFTVRRYDTGLWAGDSLTQFGWFSVAGGMVDQINAQIGTTSVADQRVLLASGGAFPTIGGVAAKLKGGAINVINRGVSGWSSTEIFNDKANVVALKPNFVVLDIGINDATLGVSPATYRSNLDGTLDAYQAGGISQILFVSPLVVGELWTHVGPAFSGNGFDAAIDAIIVQAQASCASHSVPFVPLRPQALAYIIANGPAEPGASFGTLVDSSQKHPIVPGGQLWMCGQVMPNVTVVP